MAASATVDVSGELEAREIFTRRGALREGHFLLSSGLHSPVYLQCQAVLAFPDDAARVLGALARRFAADGVTAVLGPALGAIVPAYEAARALGARALFAEREEKAFRLRRGQALEAADRVLMIENVVTTGGSVREALEPVTQAGATLVGIGALVDRAEGEPFPGVRFERLLRVRAPSYEAASCPLCREGHPLESPGSRHLRR
jgi:orotate phosphoribosyltransferase